MEVVQNLVGNVLPIWTVVMREIWKMVEQNGVEMAEHFPLEKISAIE